MLGGILTAGSNLSGEERSWGRDESVRRGAGSQWIVAARPLCHLQCPVAYLSRLQRIQPTARWEGSFEAAGHSTSAGPALPKGPGPWGGRGPKLGGGGGGGGGGACLLCFCVL